HVYLQGGAEPEAGKESSGFAKEQVKSVLEAGGELTREEMLRCRVRYFADGAVLGSRDFVEKVFEKNRKLFGKRRQEGSRPMKGGDQWGGLVTARALRLQAITVSGAS
ncbi:MAG: chemotaxis protein CheW, partial [Verrucomicrobiota bacterium]|nr:chemotaxis protein CheW [Verrucomicrobiota bacterium]